MALHHNVVELNRNNNNKRSPGGGKSSGSSNISSFSSTSRDAIEYVRYLLEGSGAESLADDLTQSDDSKQSPKSNPPATTSNNSARKSNLPIPEYNTKESPLLNTAKSEKMKEKVVTPTETHNPTQDFIRKMNEALSAISSSSKSTASASDDLPVSSTPNTAGMNTPSRSKDISLNELSLTQSTPSKFNPGVRKEVGRSLRYASELLKTSGFSPLPQSCLALETIIPQGHCDAIANCISDILSEYHQRGNVIQHMIEKLSQKDNTIIELKNVCSNSSAPLTPPHAPPSPDSSRPLRRQILENEKEKLMSDLTELEGKYSHLQQKYQVAKLHLSDLQKKEELLTNELRALQKRSESEKKRTIQTFHEVMKQYYRFQRHPEKSGIDSIILDIVSVYEEKISELNRELQETRNQNLPEEIAHPVDQTCVECQKRDKEHDDTSALKEELMKTKSLLKSSSDANELLKLKLLQVKFPSELRSERKSMYNEKKSISTRELMKRDKLNWKLNLYKIDEMSIEEAKDVLKDVCVALGVDSIWKVVPVLEDVEKVLLLISKMQKFIENVFEIVWGGSLKKVTGKDIDVCGYSKVNVLQTKDILVKWRDNIISLGMYQEFCKKIFELLGVQQVQDKVPLGKEAFTRIEKECVDKLASLIY